MLFLYYYVFINILHIHKNVYMQCTYPSLNSKNAHPKDVNIPVVAAERVCVSEIGAV